MLNRGQSPVPGTFLHPRGIRVLRKTKTLKEVKITTVTLRGIREARAGDEPIVKAGNKSITAHSCAISRSHAYYPATANMNPDSKRRIHFDGQRVKLQGVYGS
jgi:hypothetical protein